MTPIVAAWRSFHHAFAFLVSAFFIWLAAGPAMADQTQVMILTWRGETQAEQGFRQGLADAGVDAHIVTYDANRDRNALASFIRENIDQIRNADIVYTFGTTTAQVLHAASGGQTNHVFNIVSDPVSAGIIDNMDRPGDRTTGTSHVVPLDIAFQLLEGVKPFQTLGFMFDPNEENTVTRMRTAAQVLNDLGKTIKPIRVVPEADILHQQVDRLAEELKGVDMLYIPSGSSLIANANDLFAVLPDDILVVGAVGAYVEAGAAFALGPDYFERGLVTAGTAVEILNGAVPGTIPVNQISMDGINLVARADSEDVYNLDFSSVENEISIIE